MTNSRTLTQMREELKREEALLKNIKNKLVDQLQRLKVEELALVKYLSTGESSNFKQVSSSTGSYFKNNNRNMNETEQDINIIPLVDLTSSNTLISNQQSGVDEEEEEDDD
ncbi:snRNA-activating protein complex subunit 5-like [Xenia sp. Carnegie-2017]|uniref:snRNA-activating protein complex subunit 5-like n=1 Tax=Xenia sp. Carnegie-2017 TaxID=2897299 RepID=UPI001F045AE6|nr:snRNA-activating protein complex subunit 5-like [Xenia sp. Carnegie-2017]